jgi:AraC family transcriptional regulator, exoenzyme S synthesis regulatory protein ExsA
VKPVDIKSCYIGPEISPEQFISEHFFLYLAKGTFFGYDRDKQYILKAGECCVIRKNHLAWYRKQKELDEFAKVIIIFDEAFLKIFQARHEITATRFASTDAFVRLEKSPLITDSVQSMAPYQKKFEKIDGTFLDAKREKLLMLLLQSQPALAGVFFDFGAPEKIDLEAFMNKNYKFNVSVDRFAYLTGRSLSAFKRDFKALFNDTPSHWLIQRRLEEAHFLLEKKGGKTSEVYQDVGFLDLSHFSFAFKKRFGYSPAELQRERFPAVKRS